MKFIKFSLLQKFYFFLICEFSRDMIISSADSIVLRYLVSTIISIAYVRL